MRNDGECQNQGRCKFLFDEKLRKTNKNRNIIREHYVSSSANEKIRNISNHDDKNLQRWVTSTVLMAGWTFPTFIVHAGIFRTDFSKWYSDYGRNRRRYHEFHIALLAKKLVHCGAVSITQSIESKTISIDS